MKFIKMLLFVVVIASFVTTSDLSAQKKVRAFHEAVSGDPIALLWGYLNGRFEYQINPENSISGLLQYASYGTLTGIGIGASFRWYLVQNSDKAIKGFSFGPLLMIVDYTNTTNAISADVSSSSKHIGTFAVVGAEAAYKFIIDSGFLVEPNFTLYFPTATYDALNSKNFTFFSVGVSIGYAWP